MRVAVVVLVVLLAGAGAARPARAAEGKAEPCVGCLRAGAASATLSLPEGTPLAGYGTLARRLAIPDLFDRYPHAFWFKPHQGRLDPLAARALVLESGGVRLVWITVDLIAVDREFTDAVTARLGTGRATPAVVISASHTHSGPGAFVDSALLGFLAVDRQDLEVRRALVDGIVATVERAADRLAPARLGVGAVDAPPVTVGRLAPAPDPEMIVVKVVSSTGTPIALVWNYAIHGTMLGPRNLALSGDVMGVASWALERELGVPALFVNGAEGDVSPRGHGQAAALAVGRELATTARGAWSRIEPSSDGALRVKSARITLGPAALSMRRCVGRVMPPWLALPLGRAFPTDAVLTAGSIGPAAWVTIPGELASALGRRIKDVGRDERVRSPASPASPPFVAGLSNDYLGYFLEPDAYGGASYPACASVYGPSTGVEIVRAASSLLRDLGDQGVNTRPPRGSR